MEKRAAAAAACCCKNDVERLLDVLLAMGVVDDEGVGERERRDIGDRERDRDLDEPDAAEDFDDDDEDDRLIGALVLCDLGGGDEGTMSAFARSGRGGGSKDFSDNVLIVLKEQLNRERENSMYFSIN